MLATRSYESALLPPCVVSGAAAGVEAVVCAVYARLQAAACVCWCFQRVGFGVNAGPLSKFVSHMWDMLLCALVASGCVVSCCHQAVKVPPQKPQ